MARCIGQALILGWVMIKKMNGETCFYYVARLVWRKVKQILCYVSYIKYYIRDKKLEAANNDIPITVSLTTYPERVKWLPVVIGSILDQKRVPNRIVLYLSAEQFESRENAIFNKLKKQGIIIKFKQGDMRSHKKYIYAMQEYPEDIIVTVDDDIVYDKNLLDDLYASYKKHPKAVSAKRVHKIKFDKNNNVKKYCDWDIATKRYTDLESKELVATGCGGILYPPNSLNVQYLNADLIKETCMYADDLWLKVMELLNGIPVVLCHSKKYTLRHIWNTECSGLALENVGGTGNDEQLHNICSKLNINLYELIYEAGNEQ